MPKITLESGEVVELSQAKAVQKPRRWKPELREYYYYVYVDDFGDTDIELFSGDKMDMFRYAQRNMFETKKEAEQYLEYLETVAEYRDLIEKLNEGWVPDWSDRLQNKYYFCISHHRSCLEVDSFTSWQMKESWHYIKSKEVAKEVIKTLGEDKVRLVIKGM